MHSFFKIALLGFMCSAMAFNLEDYATEYEDRRTTYLEAANALKLATGPYKAARDAYVAATATYTKSLYERRRLGEAPNLEQLKVFQDAYWKAGSSSSALDTAEAIDKLMSSVRTPGRKLDHGSMLEDFAATYRETRDAYLGAANALKMATGPYKAARDAYVAASATYTKSLYERRRLMNLDNLSLDDLEKLGENPDLIFSQRHLFGTSVIHDEDNGNDFYEGYVGSDETQNHFSAWCSPWNWYHADPESECLDNMKQISAGRKCKNENDATQSTVAERRLHDEGTREGPNKTWCLAHANGKFMLRREK